MKIKTAHKSSLAKWQAMCFYQRFVLNQSAVLRLSFCGKKPAHRKSANRY